MMDTTAARQIVLDRIRASLESRDASPRVGRNQGDAVISREYRSRALKNEEERLQIFEHRLREYGAGVYFADKNGIRESVCKILQSRQKRLLAVPDGIPTEWLPESCGFMQSSGWTAETLDRCEGVLTACTVAIALTGSIVLQNSPGQGSRQMSLVPDYHLCIVFSDQIVETVPEAFARLAATATLPTTFISGPSATADIEMTRIKGVHGPRTLDILIAKDREPH